MVALKNETISATAQTLSRPGIGSAQAHLRQKKDRNFVEFSESTRRLRAKWRGTVER
jgi:hypothetical protein